MRIVTTATIGANMSLIPKSLDSDSKSVFSFAFGINILISGFGLVSSIPIPPLSKKSVVDPTFISGIPANSSNTALKAV